MVMTLPEVWPRQRANARKKKLSQAEREYRARVRRNKTKVAVAASNARISADRAVIRNGQRLRNKAIIEQNQRAIDAALTDAHRALKRRRKDENTRRWDVRLATARKASREASHRARRAFQITLATPKWANRGAMLALYRQAKRVSAETGEPHHVDHVVPILSSRVCGLHCEANMAILPGVENTLKNNRRWPDMP